MTEEPLPLAYAPPTPSRRPWFVTVPVGLVFGGLLTGALLVWVRDLPPWVPMPVPPSFAMALLFPHAKACGEVFGGRATITSLVGFGQYPIYFGAVGLGVSRGRAGRAAAWAGGVHALGFAVWLLARLAGLR